MTYTLLNENQSTNSKDNCGEKISLRKFLLQSGMSKVSTSYASNEIALHFPYTFLDIQGGSNMTGTDLCVNKSHCAAAVRP